LSIVDALTSKVSAIWGAGLLARFNGGDNAFT
jgi:hypothetical protein